MAALRPPGSSRDSALPACCMMVFQTASSLLPVRRLQMGISRLMVSVLAPVAPPFRVGSAVSRILHTYAAPLAPKSWVASILQMNPTALTLVVW